MHSKGDDSIVYITYNNRMSRTGDHDMKMCELQQMVKDLH